MENAHSHNAAPKVGHRKSRNGCHKCKTRRVKCDESRPLCNNCARLGLMLECTWPRQRHQYQHRHEQASEAHPVPASISTSTSTSSLPAKSTTVSHGQPCASASSTSVDLDEDGDRDEPRDDLPESRSRRLLEHRLMQNWFLNMTDVFPVSSNLAWRNIFAKTMPALALKFDNLFYNLLVLSATNLLSREPNNREIFQARQSYLVSAIREQRKMIDTMSMDNAVPVCLASLLILINSFAMLQERVLEPYTSPTEWLQMGKGAGSILRTSVGYLMKYGDGSNSELLTMANSAPHIGLDESYFDPSMRAEFDAILNQVIPSGDTWDDETRDAYEKTLSYVGSIQKAIRRGEPVYVLARRTQAFPMVVPHKFVDFLTEQRPRALVILAHYFATLSQITGVWWLGGGTEGSEPTARREIRAIQKVLPEEWQGHMIWPLDTLGSS
ncbi:hypothetical protein N431DRAFT_437298 [Stipitochalara longipes BDJ]|nr:hypothetical protein N431DRAFT_437298 [Stipitochalara longipes BDJ]